MFFRRLTFIITACFFLLGVLVNLSCAQTGDKDEKIEQAIPGVESETKKPEESEPPHALTALMETSLGNIKIELFEKEAPATVKNFVNYVKEKFYDGTIFHRVIQNFMIQGGGFTQDMTQKPTHPPIKNEATNKISNKVGTLAMARTAVIDSATSQFFINLKDNQFLDHRNDSMQGYGYCVFGKVLEGMDVVNKIAGVSTSTKGHYQNVPVTPVIIKSVRLLP